MFLRILTGKTHEQPPELFYQKSVLRNFKKFTGKTYARVSFLIKLQTSTCNFIKKETQAHVFFPVNFTKFLRTHFLQNTSGWLFLKTRSKIKLKRTKNMAMDVWVVRTLNQQFVRGSYTEIKFSKKKKKPLVTKLRSF